MDEIEKNVMGLTTEIERPSSHTDPGLLLHTFGWQKKGGQNVSFLVS